VRTVPSVLDKAHFGLGQARAGALDFARFGPRILSAVEKCDRYLQPAELPAIEILLRPLALGGKLQPDPTVSLYNVPPLPRTMVRRQHCLQFLAHISGMTGESVKETARAGLVGVKMECFQNEALAALRGEQADHGSNDRSVAVPPKKRMLDFEGVQHKKSLFGGPPVEIEGQGPTEFGRATVAGTIWNDEVDVISQGFDLPIDWVHSISPSPVQEHERLASTCLPVVNPYGRHCGGVRRFL